MTLRTDRCAVGSHQIRSCFLKPFLVSVRSAVVSRSTSEQFIQRELLEHEVSRTPFIDDADVPGVDSCQTGIARPSAFVEQQVMVLGPRPAVAGADLDL